MIKRTLITLSITTLLSASSAIAFVGGGDEGFSFGNTLVDAVDQNNVDIVRAAISQGNDLNEPGKFETTALHRAAFNGNVEIANILIANGADVNIRDYGGASPLHIAAREGKDDITKTLVQKKADINSQDDQGYTPLHRAIANRKASVSSYLIGAGANVNTINNEGNSPLIDAVRISDPEIVKELLIRGADRKVINSKGLGAVDYALKIGNSKIDNILGKTSQQLMMENAASSSSAVTADNAVNAMPEFLRKEVTPFSNSTIGNYESDVIKVPTASVEVQDLEQLADNISQNEAAHRGGVQNSEIQRSIPLSQTTSYQKAVSPANSQIAAVSPTPLLQINKPFEMAELQFTGNGFVPKNETKTERAENINLQNHISDDGGLQRAPRLPKEGNLPGDLKKDIAESKKLEKQKEYEKAQKAHLEQLKNIKPIELPIDNAQIENSSANSINISSVEPTIAAPVFSAPEPKKATYDIKQHEYTEDRSSEKVAEQKATEKLVRAVYKDDAEIEPEDNLSVAQVAAVPFSMRNKAPAPYVAPVAAPVPYIPDPIAINSVQKNIAPIQNIPSTHNSESATIPVDSLQIVSESANSPEIVGVLKDQNHVVIQNKIPASMTQPAIAAKEKAGSAYESEVDSLMNDYAKDIDVSNEYEMEVDNLMNQVVTQMEAPSPTIMKVEPSAAQAENLIAPAYPLSLTIKSSPTAGDQTNNHGMDAYQKEVDMILNQQLQPTNYSAEPIYSATHDTIEQHVEALKTEPVIPEEHGSAGNAPVVENKASRPVSGTDYNSYRSNLLENINEFYNSDHAYKGYDMSDLDKQRMQNLGMQPKAQPEQAPVPVTDKEAEDFLQNDYNEYEIDSKTLDKPAVEKYDFDKIELDKNNSEAKKQ